MKANSNSRTIDMRIQNIFAPSDKHQRGAFLVWFRLLFIVVFRLRLSCSLHFPPLPSRIPPIVAFYRLSNSKRGRERKSFYEVRAPWERQRELLKLHSRIIFNPALLVGEMKISILASQIMSNFSLRHNNKKMSALEMFEGEISKI